MSVSRAIETVDRYLALCEDRRLDEATLLLADNAELIFPGAVRHQSLEDMVAAAARRYRRVDKARSHYHAGVQADGSVVVVSRGELRGTNLQGRSFEGIRYVDVFIVRHDRIQQQHVFNDLCETGVLR